MDVEELVEETGTMAKDRSRAENRHHKRRVWNKRRHYRTASAGTPRAMGMAATTPKPCSCVMCCNPRHTNSSFKDTATRQERRDRITVREQIKEA